MSAETLRRAAELMRERVEVATEGPWRAEPSDGDVWAPNNREAICRTRSWAYGPDAEHIASWHPAVALAVADWLTIEADRFEQSGLDYADELACGRYPYWAPEVSPSALALARTYLGESA